MLFLFCTFLLSLFYPHLLTLSFIIALPFCHLHHSRPSRLDAFVHSDSQCCGNTSPQASWAVKNHFPSVSAHFHILRTHSMNVKSHLINWLSKQNPAIHLKVCFITSSRVTDCLQLLIGPIWHINQTTFNLWIMPLNKKRSEIMNNTQQKRENTNWECSL